MAGKEKILIIEDHKAVRILLSNFLEKTFEVKTTSNGFEALSWMQKGNIPSAIVLDLNMPELSGVDFLKNIRSSGFFQDIPVLLVSAEEDNEMIEKSIELGINAYIKKPFNPSEIQSKILTILKKNKSAIKLS